MQKIFTLLVSLCCITIASAQAVIDNFRAFQTGNNIQVNFTATVEQNMATHEIEKSTNGINYYSIGTVQAVNERTSPHQYVFVDASPSNGDNYYRLKVTPRNGASVYSLPLRINASYYQPDLVINSNPLQGRMMNLQMLNFEKGRYHIYMYDMLGTPYHIRSMDITGGSASENVPIPATLKSGIYIVQVINSEHRFRNSEHRFSRRVMIQ
jgi:hypothetical protein